MSDAPNTVGQPEQVAPSSSPQAYSSVSNGFLDYLRDAAKLASPSGQMQQAMNARYKPSDTPNNLGKAAGAAQTAGLCGGAGGAAAAL